MKAAWYEQQGPADKVLQVGVMSIPQLASDEVLIRIYASGVNPSDIKRRQGTREKMPYPRIIPHSDGAGIIEAVGENVAPARIGQRVYIYNAQWKRPFGTAAEFVALPEHLAVPLPHNTSFEAGACLGIPAMTAHYGVFSDGSVRGKTILVSGGAGNVGHYAIQLAKWGGAQVITTVSSDEKAQAAVDFGADYVLNYRQENIVQKVKEITGGEGVDRVVEVDFGGNLEINREILKVNGYIATYASMGNTKPELPFYSLMFKGITIRFIFVYELPQNARLQAIKDLQIALSAGVLSHPVAAKFPLEDIVASHQYVEKGSYIGQVLLEL